MIQNENFETVKKTNFTWDMLFERADGAGHGEQALRAKDEARAQLRDLIRKRKEYDIEEMECPEDEIDAFLKEQDQQPLFDDRGNIVA